MLTSLARRLLFAVGVAAASPAALASVPSSDEPLASDAYTYDTVTGRLVTWPSTGPELGLPNDPEHEGAATYTYGPNNALVVRTDGSDAKFYFEELSYDTETGTAIYDVLPMLRVRGDELLWAFVEPDGHPFALSDQDGAWVSVEVAGAFGRPIAKLGTWDEESLHGSELDRDRRLTQMGVRHVSHADGRWLQPEPLLATSALELAQNPLGAANWYAGGAPTVLADPSGNWPDGNPSGTNLNDVERDAAWDAVTTVAVVTVVAATPVPEETILGMAGARLVGAFPRVAALLGLGDEAADAGKAASNVADASKAADVTTLHRAVGPDELADIKAAGELRAGPGMEGKWFAESADDAATWGEKMDFGGKSTVIEADFPTSTVDQMYKPRGNLDGIGPARYAEESQLRDCCGIRIPSE